MKSLKNVTVIIGLLLSCNLSDCSTTTTTAAKDKHTAVSATCQAFHFDLNHEGKISQFKANCQVNIGHDHVAEHANHNGIRLDSFESTHLSDIHSQNNYLKHDAALKHHECIDKHQELFKRTLKLLPMNLTKTDDIIAAVNGSGTGTDIHLAPHVGLYIGYLDDTMKKKLAEVFSAQQNKELSQTQRLEALKEHHTTLVEHLDNICKESDPSIKYHGVTYLPSKELKEAKITLISYNPGEQVKILNLPKYAYSHHIGYLQSMTEAALHHGQTTGHGGHFEVTHHPAPNPAEEREIRNLMGMDHPGLYNHFTIPSVIAVHAIPSDHKHELAPASAPVSESVSAPESSQVLDSVKEQPNTPHTSVPSDSVVSEKLESEKLNSSDAATPEFIKDKLTSAFYNEVQKIQTDYVTALETEKQEVDRAIKSEPDAGAIKAKKTKFESRKAEIENDRSAKIIEQIVKYLDLENKEIGAKGRYYAVPDYDSTTKLWKKKFDALSEPEKVIETKYQQDKAFLHEASKYFTAKNPVKKDTSILGAIKGTQKGTFADEIYKIGKNYIQQIRVQDKEKLLNDKNGDETSNYSTSTNTNKTKTESKQPIKDAFNNIGKSISSGLGFNQK